MYYNNIALIVHGMELHNLLLQAPYSWQYLIVGDLEKQMLGRMTMGLYLALKYRALLLIFGTGSTLIHKTTKEILKRHEWVEQGQPDGYIFEAEFTKNLAIKLMPRLTKIPVFKEEYLKIGGLEPAINFIRGISRVETDSFNSATEIVNGLIMSAEDLRIRLIMRITNWFHQSRCDATIREAIQRFNYLHNGKFSRRFDAVMSATCDTDIPGRVSIQEPWSGKGPNARWNEALENAFLIPRDQQAEISEKVRRIINIAANVE